MKKVLKENDTLRPEYDLSALKVVAAGRGRGTAKSVQLEPDVAKAFPTSEAVNTALRKLIQEGKYAQ